MVGDCQGSVAVNAASHVSGNATTRALRDDVGLNMTEHIVSYAMRLSI
jgi:hypothetical protein